MPSPTPAQLKRDRDRFVGFAFAAADVLIDVDRSGAIVSALGAVHATVNRSPEDLVGAPLIELFPPESRARVRAAFEVAAQKGRMTALTSRVCGPDGPLSVRVGGVFAADGAQVTLTLLPHASGQQTDEASGLLSGASFAEEVATLLLEPGAEAKRTLTMVELEGLEQALGQRPDQREDILATLGAVMREHAEGGLAAQFAPNRYGLLSGDGERAAHALNDFVTGAPPGVSFAHKQVDADAAGLAPDDLRGALLYVVREFAAHGLSGAPNSLAKCFHDMLADAVRRVDLLRSTMSGGPTLVYQPICLLADGSVSHHEVLTRVDGEASPQQTIEFAEHLGIVGELDLEVARLAIERLENGCPTPLAVNVSARSLSSDLFVTAFLELTSRHPKVRRSLMVELTETVEIKDLARAGRVLATFRKAGHAVCIDDFGSGAASFAYLRELPAQYIKIDGAYVDHLATSDTDRSIVGAVVSLAHGLGMKTVAERVETEAQADVLRMLDVDLGQGWLYGKPAEAPIATLAPAKPQRIARRKGYQESWG